jgi:hypothetical protein
LGGAVMKKSLVTEFFSLEKPVTTMKHFLLLPGTLLYHAGQGAHGMLKARGG